MYRRCGGTVCRTGALLCIPVYFLVFYSRFPYHNAVKIYVNKTPLAATSRLMPLHAPLPCHYAVKIYVNKTSLPATSRLMSLHAYFHVTMQSKCMSIIHRTCHLSADAFARLCSSTDRSDKSAAMSSWRRCSVSYKSAFGHGQADRQI